jgi:copper(I)-binding protein
MKRMKRMNADNPRASFEASLIVSTNESTPYQCSSALSVSSVFQRFAVTLCAMLASLSHAEVTVKDAWVRGTVPAQTTTGAFMTLTSTSEAKLVGAASPVAKMVEIHESSMHGNMAHMQEVSAVPLPAGKAVQLKPGGHHVMLMGVAKPLKPGETVPITLTIEEKGKRSTIEVKAAVRPIGSQ